MKLSELKVNPNNPRTIKDARFKKLCNSIRDFPKMMAIRPIVIDKANDNLILGGNMRYLALKALKFTDIPDEWVKDAAELTEDEKRRFIAVDNLGFGDWDYDLLANSFDTSDLVEWGFDEKELGITQEPVDAEPQIDRAEELNKKWQIKTGDLFSIADHRLLCGDSLDIESVRSFLQGERVDLAFTDPPYGVSYSEKNIFLNAISRGNRIQTPIENDNCSEKDIMVLWKKSFEVIRDVLADVNSYYIFGPQIQGMMMMMMQDAGLPYRHVIIWVKNNHVLGRCDYHYRHEPIFFGWTKTHKFYGCGQFKSSVWEVDKPLKSDLHPTMKPVPLFENGILNSTEKGQIVFDPFSGSGPCMVACQNLNRKCRGIEISPPYCAVILERMAIAFPGIEIKKL